VLLKLDLGVQQTHLWPGLGWASKYFEKNAFWQIILLLGQKSKRQQKCVDAAAEILFIFQNWIF
jgi:hypothetical protein